MPDQSISDDHDSPWKEALERYFPEFLALLFPEVHAGNDWSRGHSFLDKELQQVVRDAEAGRRHADKLVRVCAADGAETWVLVHVEVQGRPEAAFAERMFTYHYRLLDRYARDVVSLAVLADASPGFRPSSYRRGRWGCELAFRFPVAKLLDWAAEPAWSKLEASESCFALVVMAQIRARATRDAEQRRAWKFRLVRLMYDRRYSRDVILELFRVIDWMIRLPEDLEEAFREELYQLEEAKRMPYVTTVERAGIEKGLQQGLAQGQKQGQKQGEAAVLLRQLTRKFGLAAAEAHRAPIEAADAETLLAWSERILDAETPEDIFDAE
ncbi:MAG: DUF4351 domain-containing protein [Gammaproteobacteria bacterium]|nr:DUF4351 domain-containing protein [Gammaproteobacteria bacterium]